AALFIVLEFKLIFPPSHNGEFAVITGVVGGLGSTKFMFNTLDVQPATGTKYTSYIPAPKFEIVCGNDTEFELPVLGPIQYKLPAPVPVTSILPLFSPHTVGFTTLP